MALMSRDKETGAGSGPGQADDTPHYQAFLSYSHVDSDHADWLHKAIERFAVPKGLVGRVTAYGAVPRSLTPIFRDRHELAASSDLGQTIRQALKASRFLIVLCSPAAAASRWVNEEIIAFKKLHGEKRVLAAIVAGEPWTSEIAGREAEECFPLALRERYDRRGHATGKRAEPIAADLREAGDGREAGQLKLVAGMLGLGLDDLVRREQQRRQKRLTYIAAASIAGMTVTSGLAVFAFDKRDEARDQRREAEGLVGFMLGDLREVLEPIGKLEALDVVGTRALKYFENQDKSELSDAALAQRSQALNLLAQIANSRQDPNAAEAGYREAMRSTAELLGRSPDDPQRLFDHAQNVFYLGEIARNSGDAKRAETAFRDYKVLADRMVAIDPGNLKWQMEVLYGKENVGLNLFDQRRFAEARRLFEEALKPMAAGVSVDGQNADYKREYSTLLAWLADSYAAQGKFEQAVAVREKQIAFLRPLAEGQSNVVFLQHLIPAHMGLANLLLLQGETERGIEQLRLSIDQSERLLPIEPDNAFWSGLAAPPRLKLAETLLSLDLSAGVAMHVQIACGQVARVVKRNPGTTWRWLKTDCLSARGRLALASGDLSGALHLAEQSLATAKTERDADPINDRYQIAHEYLLLGDVRQRLGNGPGARAAWTAGLDQLPLKVAERPSETRDRADLLRRLGRKSEADKVMRGLNAIGYRGIS